MPREAMQARSMPSYGVYLFVRPSIMFVRERINISSIFFNRGIATPF